MVCRHVGSCAAFLERHSDASIDQLVRASGDVEKRYLWDDDPE